MKLFSIKSLLIVSAVAVASVAFAANTDVQIPSAIVKDQPIAGASITLQKNGEQSALATMGSAGSAQCFLRHWGRR